MSANKTKKVKMATKSCPECDQQIPVACKSCPCGYVFISRKLLNAKLNERTSPALAAGVKEEEDGAHPQGQDRLPSVQRHGEQEEIPDQQPVRSHPEGAGQTENSGAEETGRGERETREGSGHLCKSLRREGLCVFRGLG
ncbi:UPF0547 protein C16orf87 homolog isoform X2 [Genypterus blacodes]|uniref:UPF0547 protein C16orf87 homolog isoform X2 n=1 Tax=Genypterus blacodes TaxID=154954 RepID=UPI003F7676A8